MISSRKISPSVLLAVVFVLAAIAIQLSLAAQVWATAGRCVGEVSGLTTGDVVGAYKATTTITYLCTADSGDGTFPSNMSLNIPTSADPYMLALVETWPGSPAPSNSSSVALVDSHGRDLLGGKGSALISSTVLQDTLPYSSFMGSYRYPILYDSANISLTGNNVLSAKVYLRVTYIR